MAVEVEHSDADMGRVGGYSPDRGILLVSEEKGGTVWGTDRYTRV